MEGGGVLLGQQLSMAVSNEDMELCRLIARINSGFSVGKVCACTFLHVLKSKEVFKRQRWC